MRPLVALSPTTPLAAAGKRTEPPVSVPSAAALVPSAAEIRYLLRQPNIFAIMSNKPDRVLALREER